MKFTIAQYRKFLVALTAAVGEAASLGLLHGTAENITTVVLGFAGALAVAAVPNAQPDLPPAP